MIKFLHLLKAKLPPPQPSPACGGGQGGGVAVHGRALFWVVPALLLAGCEFEIPGQKAKDAAAMGYACRISKKSPELCMRENPTFSQTAILEGWRDADKDVKDKKVDTNFAAPPPVAVKPAGEEKKEGEAGTEAAPPAPEGEKKPEAEAKPAEPVKGH